MINIPLFGDKFDYFRIKNLEHGRVYRVAGRKMHIGVWDEHKQAFLGIEEDCGSKFLSYEWHYDAHDKDRGVKNFGTAKPWELLDIEVPDGIELFAQQVLVSDAPGKSQMKRNQALYDFLMPFDAQFVEEAKDENFNRKCEASE